MKQASPDRIVRAVCARGRFNGAPGEGALPSATKVLRCGANLATEGGWRADSGGRCWMEIQLATEAMGGASLPALPHKRLTAWRYAGNRAQDA